MKTYDSGAATHGSDPFWRSFRRLFTRLIDRERELVSLRNAVGMMAEARRADAAEYHDMAEALKAARDRFQALSVHCATKDVLIARLEAAIKNRGQS